MRYDVSEIKSAEFEWMRGQRKKLKSRIRAWRLERIRRAGRDATLRGLASMFERALLKLD